METQENPFDVFLQDPSRKLVLGDMGTLRIESKVSALKKKEQVIAMIQQNRLVAAPGCRLKAPVINNKMLIIQAEDERNNSTEQTVDQLLAIIKKTPVQAAPVDAVATRPLLESLLKTMNAQPQSTASHDSEQIAKDEANDGVHLAGYIVFFGICLLALRRAPTEK